MLVDSISFLLLELKELVIKNGDGVYGDLEQAIKDIEDCLECMDNSKISLLIAPTANLQDLSIDAGWQDEFLDMASKIDKLLSIPTEDGGTREKMNRYGKSKNNIDIVLTTTEGSKRKIIIIETEEIIELSNIIVLKFNLIVDGDWIHDIVGDQGSKKYKKGIFKISIGWGAYFPFMTWAENLESDKLVEEIFEWLQTIDIPT